MRLAFLQTKKKHLNAELKLNTFSTVCYLICEQPDLVFIFINLLMFDDYWLFIKRMPQAFFDWMWVKWYNAWLSQKTGPVNVLNNFQKWLLYFQNFIPRADQSLISYVVKLRSAFFVMFPILFLFWCSQTVLQMLSDRVHCIIICFLSFSLFQIVTALKLMDCP